MRRMKGTVGRRPVVEHRTVRRMRYPRPPGLDLGSVINRIFWIAFGFVLATAWNAHAGERHVVGGDIMHESRAPGRSPEALWIAQAMAVHAVVSECGFAHKDIRIFSHGYDNGDAVVMAGIPYESCDEAKRASPLQRKSLENSELAADQELLRKRAAARPEPKAAPDRTEEILDKIEDLASKLDRPTPAPVVLVQRVVASPSEGCRAQREALLRRASAAAAHNYPPGNMTEGQALDLFNQAQDLHCP